MSIYPPRLLYIFLYIIEIASATYRIDEPDAYQEPVKFAKALPYAMGIILGKDSKIGSAIFLNDTTVLTCAHSFLDREKVENIIVASDHIELQANHANAFKWNETISQIKSEGKAHSFIERVSMLCTYVAKPRHEGKTIKLEELIRKLHAFESWNKSHFNNSAMPYEREGLDLAVVKLISPIKLSKKVIALKPMILEELIAHPSYVVGAPEVVSTSDGLKITSERPTEKGFALRIAQTAILTYNIKYSPKDAVYYTSLPSRGDGERQFICQDLPLPTSHRFIGLGSAGMSGGPLFFQDKNDDFVLGGLYQGIALINLIPQVKTYLTCIEFWNKSIIKGIEETGSIKDTMRVNVELVGEHEEQKQALLEHFQEIGMTEEGITIDGIKEKSAQRQAKVQALLDRQYPIYSIFQAFTPEVIEKVNNEVLYLDALKFRDAKDESKAQAEPLFLQLAEKGHVKSMHNYAMIQDGKKAYELAYQWFQKAANLGFKASERNCERMVNDGKIQKQ